MGLDGAVLLDVAQPLARGRREGDVEVGAGEGQRVELHEDGAQSVLRGSASEEAGIGTTALRPRGADAPLDLPAARLAPLGLPLRASRPLDPEHEPTRRTDLLQP
jgi:hypothetical protein